MSKPLVIVESPTKARTIGRFLGGKMNVLASMGHVRDLPRGSLGVDVHHGFKPAYVLTKNGKRVSKDLRKAAAAADCIYLATDPDREGEAIAWHVREMLKRAAKVPFHRVTFHEITAGAIQRSFDHAGEVSMSLVDAQQARRVIDRLVGYQVSPLLWKRIKRGTSAGRVQSVALRLVVDREREIQAFEPVEYWTMEAVFMTRDPAARLETRLSKVDGSKPEIPDGETAEAYAGDIEAAAFEVARLESKPRRQSAPPPFITSTLQQLAGRSLRMAARDTMRVAQQLYEGIDLGGNGSTGLITYMRTDSVTVAPEAQRQARDYVRDRWGADYVPEKPNRYRSRKSAQEAHEAIRPTDVTKSPEKVAAYLNRNQLRLYRLIWNRFVASQMSPARQLDHAIEIDASGDHLTHAYTFRAASRETVFPGYLAVYAKAGKAGPASDSDANGGKDEPKELPRLPVGTVCDLEELVREQCFTKPPKRFTEATLVRELEANGVGRPSTYAATVNTIQERKYVSREKRELVPTDLGCQVNDYLVGQMPKLFDVGFTAQLERDLDRIEEGDCDWQAMVAEFYGKFTDWVDVELVAGAPSAERAAEFLTAFPDDLDWAPPVKRGRRTYDDEAFVASLRKQAVEEGKALSDRQWNALMAVASRYVEQDERILKIAEQFGVDGRVRAYQEEARKRENQDPVPQDPKHLALLKLLADVEWAEPVTRGKRTYDDRKFYRSLRRQAEDGRALSSNQYEALKKLAAKYRSQLKDFETVAAEHGIDDQPPPAADTAEAEALVGLIGSIREWNPPTKRGRRTYDDRQFAESLQKQWKTRGRLSPRQVGALKKLVSRYAAQIPNYDTVAKAFGLGAPGGKPVKVDATCPRCEASLVRRTARGRTFYGCSSYPKCKYTTTKLPGEGEPAKE